MMRKTIAIMATVLTALALLASEAEAYGGGGFYGQAGRSSGDTFTSHHR
jgi:hypothetical protein